MAVYLLEDGRQIVNKEWIQEGEIYIEIPNFILPQEVDGQIVSVVGIEDGKPKYKYEPIPESEPTMDEKIYEAVSKSQDEVRQEGADSVMDELKKRGLIV